MADMIIADQPFWVEHLFFDAETLAQLGCACRTLRTWHTRDALWEALCKSYPLRLLEDRQLNRRTAQDLDRQYPLRCTWSSAPIIMDGWAVRGIEDKSAWVLGTAMSKSRCRIKLKVTKFQKKRAAVIFVGICTSSFAAKIRSREPCWDDRFSTQALWFASTGVLLSPSTATPYSYGNWTGFDDNDVLELFVRQSSKIEISFSINGSEKFKSKRILEKDTSLTDLRPLFRVPDHAELIFLPIDDDDDDGER